MIRIEIVGSQAARWKKLPPLDLPVAKKRILSTQYCTSMWSRRSFVRRRSLPVVGAGVPCHVLSRPSGWTVMCLRLEMGSLMTPSGLTCHEALRDPPWYDMITGDGMSFE